MITYNYLTPPFEDPAESIRKFIYDNWTITNTDNIKPKMYSPLGFDNNKSSIDTKDEHNRADYNKPKTGDYIRFYFLRSDPIQAEIMVNNITRSNIIIAIDVYAVNSNRLSLFTEELANIIFDNQPNTTIRIPKTNGDDSAIATFDRQRLDWARIGAIDDSGITRGFNAILGCTIEKFKT